MCRACTRSPSSAPAARTPLACRCPREDRTPPPSCRCPRAGRPQAPSRSPSRARGAAHDGGTARRSREASRRRYPCRDGVPSERTIALGFAGKGRRPRRGGVLGGHGGPRGVAGRARAPSPPTRHLPRAPRGRPRRRRPRAAAALVVPLPSRPLDPLDRKDRRHRRRAPLGSVRVRPSRLPLARPAGDGLFPRQRHRPRRGNHLLEAVSHALCEAVERDAFALWEERVARDREARRIDLDTVTDPGCRELLAVYERAGVGVVAWDLTTDIGLPVFSATIVDRRSDALRRLPAATGGGCHPDRAVALSRALTEAAQSRLTLIAGSRDDCGPDVYRRLRDAGAIGSHLGALSAEGTRSFADVADVPGATIDDDVTHELDRLRAAGIRQAILVDLTRPDVGVPVVRMVVPGLEGWTDKVAPAVAGPRRRALRER